MRFSFDEVAQHFTGIALELTPTAKFEKKTMVQRLRLSHFWQRIIGLKRSLVATILLSLFGFQNILVIYLLAQCLFYGGAWAIGGHSWAKRQQCMKIS